MLPWLSQRSIRVSNGSSNKSITRTKGYNEQLNTKEEKIMLILLTLLAHDVLVSISVPTVNDGLISVHLQKESRKSE